MTAGWFLARAELRARLWSTLVLAIAGGLALGFALAGIAGARRGPDAFDRFVDYYNQSNFAVFTEDPAALGPIEQLVAEHPGVETSATTTFVTLGDVEPDGSIARTGVAAGMIAIGGDADLERPAIVRGRRPETAFEVAVNDRVATRRHLEPGARIPLAVFGADQVDGVGRSDDAPAHGVHEFTVTGIVRSPGDLEFQAEAQPGTIYQLENEMYWYPGALWEHFGGDVANYGVGVLARLAPTADTAALEDEARAIDSTVNVSVGPQSEAIFADISRTIDVQAAALGAFALAIAIVAGAAFATAVSRQAGTGVFASRTVVALGAGPSVVTAAAAQWAVVVAVVASASAVATAFALSALMPVGVARQAELARGLDFDALVLGAGALVIMVAVAALAIVTARRATRPVRRAVSRRSRPVFSAFARRAGTPAMLTGASLVEPGRSGEAGRLPSRSALIGVAAGTAAIVAALTFGASLDRVTTQPESYGWSWDVQVGNCSDSECADDVAQRLEANGGVAAWTGLTETQATVDDHVLEISAVTTEGGWAAGEILQGRPPRRDDEVVVGEKTMVAIDKELGDPVTVFAQGRTGEFTIVGVYVPAAMLADGQTLADGAAITRDAVRRVGGDELYDAASPSMFVVALDDDADRDAAMALLETDFPGTVTRPYRTSDIESAYRMRRLPLALALVVAGIGGATLVHLAALTVRRRRATLATLAALGYERRQVRATLVWQMLTVVALSVAIALPVGILLGRLAWKFVADALTVRQGIVVPTLGLVFAAAALALLGALVGTVAGNIATRRPTAEALRT